MNVIERKFQPDLHELAGTMTDTWMFDLTALRWTDLSALVSERGPVPVGRYHMAFVHSKQDALLYIFGGQFSNGTDICKLRWNSDMWIKTD